MSLKCSVLGHRFGETTVERDREEEGSEVVITITEFENCTRCGETRVVSENKEVTTMETPGDTASGGAGAESGGAGAGSGGAGAGAEGAGAGSSPDEAGSDPASGDAVAGEDSPAADDAEILDAAGGEADAQADARGSATQIPDAEADAPSPDEGEDDAVIIDGDPDPGEPGAAAGSTGADDAGSGGERGGASGEDGPGEDVPRGDVPAGGSNEPRQPGQWPEESGGEGQGQPGPAGESAAGGDPVTDAIDAGAETASAGTGEGAGGAERADAEPADAERTDIEPTDAAPVENGADAGEAGTADPWPEETLAPDRGGGDDAMDDWPEETKRDSPGDSRADGPSLEESASPTITVPEGMFKCSGCGFTTEVESSSLRAGDFCPECRQGTLVQHAEPEE